MTLPVYVYGQPVLRKEAELVTKDYENLSELIANMKETMYASNGIGIAAPQVGVSLKLVYIGCDEGRFPGTGRGEDGDYEP